MRSGLASIALVLLAAGCGPSAHIDRLSSDISSGKDPVLQVWLHAKRLSEGVGSVEVDWNNRCGVGDLDPRAVRADGVVVVNVKNWDSRTSDFDRLNEMKARVVYGGQTLTERVLQTPTEFANAFHEREEARNNPPPPERTPTPPVEEKKPEVKPTLCANCGEPRPPSAKVCPVCGFK